LLRFKASETLLGIETLVSMQVTDRITGFKASETLLGIETGLYRLTMKSRKPASKPLKPF